MNRTRAAILRLALDDLDCHNAQHLLMQAGADGDAIVSALIETLVERKRALFKQAVEATMLQPPRAIYVARDEWEKLEERRR